MSTVYDWVSVGLFCAVAIIYLERALGPAERDDPLWAYLPPVLGCVAGNLLGNEGWPLAAAAVLALSGAYVLVMLKPFRRH